MVWIRVVDPAPKWKHAAAGVARDAGLDHWLDIRIELSDYPVAQLNLGGAKAVRLGTGNTWRIPWLTSLDQPVEVVQYTGALYRVDGRFVRGGAEAFHALRTPFKESLFRVQRTRTPESFAAALAARRDDLPGAPPAWRVALTNVVANLLGGHGGYRRSRPDEMLSTWLRPPLPLRSPVRHQYGVPCDDFQLRRWIVVTQNAVQQLAFRDAVSITEPEDRRNHVPRGTTPTPSSSTAIRSLSGG